MEVIKQEVLMWHEFLIMWYNEEYGRSNSSIIRADKKIKGIAGNRQRSF